MSEPALDRSVIDVLRQLTPPGEPDVLVEILTLFLQDVPTRIAALQNAVGSGDADGVHRAAHSLKGSAGNVGAKGLQEACRVVEEMGRTKNLDGASDGVAHIVREFQRAAADAETYLPKTS
jgi:HPt (histidine-containing phosphotransfer) domain-containing protein